MTKKLEKKLLINSIIAVILAIIYVISIIGIRHHQTEQALGASIIITNATDTIGTFRTNVNSSLRSLNASTSDATSTIGAISRLATTTGNLIVGSSTANRGWIALAVGTNGQLLTASSTAPNGVSWETIGTGITSLNGLTGATQTFASSGAALVINSAGTVHTFRTVTTTINSLAINGGSITFATGTTGDALNITTSSNTVTFNLPFATNLVRGIVSIASQTFAGLKTFATGIIAQTVLEIPNGAGGTTVDATGEITVDSTSSTLNFYDGTREVVLQGEERVGGVTILGPTSTDPKVKILTVRNTAITLTAITCNLSAGSNSVDVQLSFGPDISAVGTAVYSATSTCNVTTASTTTTFANGTLGVGDMLWVNRPLLSTLSSSTALSIDVFGRRRP